MGCGIFKKLLGSLENAGRVLPDERRRDHNFAYELLDAIKSAFGIFFFQHPSMLQFQRAMQEKRKRNNVTTILGVQEIPSDTQIKTLIDDIKPEAFNETFTENLRIADSCQILDSYRVLEGGVILALDGVWYHSSEKVHCERCLHKEKGGKKTYYHSILAGTIVKPGSEAVLPVMPEMIINEDGKEYAWLKPTLLGDDLFSHYPMCKAVLDQGMSFIFTCKPDSHPWLTETVAYSYLQETSNREWNGRNHLVYTYKWLNGVEIRDDTETLLVNYLYMEIQNEEKKKTTYKCSWVTDKLIDNTNAAHLASCARSRWKIENEHNNVLKNHGYNLEHNFGHGQNHASEIFCLLPAQSACLSIPHDPGPCRRGLPKSTRLNF
jgi:hypothetical protein